MCSSDLDLTIGNLEGAISDEPVPPSSVWLHLPLDTPAMLTEAGFDLLGLANNHALDAGPAGLTETRRRLQATELEPVEGRNDGLPGSDAIRRHVRMITRAADTVRTEAQPETKVT